MTLKDIIPKEFYKAGCHPAVYTVGELIEQLQRLPKDLPLRAGFADGMELIVYNINDDDVHLTIDEAWEE